jgi:alpha-beta hydrolase superfamily lysophospholipase
MKKIVYIIPGLGEHCDEVRYKNLAKSLEKVGYNVKKINPDWYKPVSQAIFPVPKNAIVFGFSMGGVLAYLVAKKYPCKKVIFGSLSPISTFSFKSFSKDLYPYMSKEMAHNIAKDVKNIKVSLKSLKTPFITLAGEKEKMKADFLVPATEHYMSKNYINCISKLL